MTWVAIGLALALALFTAGRIWRRYIQPWREVDELLEAMIEKRAPRKFLMTGNVRATRIGLNLEQLSARLRELEDGANEREFSVQAVFGAMPDGLVVVDEKRRLRLANMAFRQTFGLEEITTPGASLLELIGHISVDRLVTEAIQTGEPRRGSLQLSRGSHPGRELEVRAVPLHENPPRSQGAVVLFHDVTERRQVEEMRRDFVANVSHELRTPLSIFRGYLETLLDDPQQPPGELLRILAVMERHSDRLHALVEDVLSLARIESPEAELDLTDIDLSEFLPAILRDWEPRLHAKELHADLEVSPELPPLRADGGRLQEVIYNLLDNAVKYSRAGSAITVRATGGTTAVLSRIKDASSTIMDGTVPVPPLDAIRLSVSDQGMGIRESDLPRIFERFYRADKARSREFGGTGLGLSIVKHIAQLHGGRVEAESTLGSGATISVIFPIAPALPARDIAND
ncbi:MAG TPA: ATP-binding protein [Chthoniobacterales bacterium]|nr:ATP-binding protein [Chthoniobacterales bacterium]